MTEATRHVLFATTPIRRADVAEFATTHGLKPLFDDPLTNGLRETRWSRDRLELSFTTSALVGSGIFVLQTSDSHIDASLRGEIVEAFDALTPDEALDQAEAADSLTDRINAVYAIAELRLANPDNTARLSEFLYEQLLSHDDIVRWASAKRLQNDVGPEVLAAFETAAARHPELQPYVESSRDQLAALEEGTLYDHPTDSYHELLDRAVDGIADGKWKRAERAMDHLLDLSPDHTEGLLLRAMVHAANTELLHALMLLSAARASVRWRDEDEIDPQVMADVDDVEARVLRRIDDEDFVGATATAAETEAIIITYRDQGYETCAAAMAATMASYFDGLDGLLFRYVGAVFDREIDELEALLQDVPDSPEVCFELGQGVKEADPERARALLEQAMELCERRATGEQLSPAAQRFAAYAPDDAVTTTHVIAAQTYAAYEAQDYERAGELADVWVELDPTNMMAWQIRPNARTFALQHEEAARLYPETLTVLDDLYSDDGDNFFIGADPRPGMHFNYACVLSKVGRGPEAIEELRHAVRADAVWAERALEDDYFGPLMEDPEFVAITQLDPRALISKDELTREHIESLVNRALGESHGGDLQTGLDYGASATDLAEIAGFDDLYVRALNIRAWTHTHYGDPGQGLDLVERALHVASRADDVDEALLAETTQYRAEALQAVGQPDEARATFERALSMKTEIFGENHPYVAKVMGGMAQLAAATGQMEQANSLLHETIARLDAYLEDDANVEQEAYSDALTDHAICVTNIGNRACADGRLDDATQELARSVESLERLYEKGYAADHTVDHAAALAEALIDDAATEARLHELRALLSRLDDLVLSPVPEVRREQKFWNRIRGLVSRMRSLGIGGDVIADVLNDALRGQQDHAALQSIPELGMFSHELARRVNDIPTLLVTSALALETARATGDVEQAVDDLEAICIGAVWDQMEADR